MRIGILTHHYINNFGAFLQAYALCEAVSKMYPESEVEIIDFINCKHFLINTCGWFRFYKNRENFKSWREKILLPGTFSKARKQHMVRSRRIFTARGVNRLNYDCIIVGSDEVWNYQDNKSNHKIKFGEGLICKNLVAYAPSVGMTQGEVPAYVKDGIEGFSRVSARDDLTESLLKSLRKDKVTRVLDPTFLGEFQEEGYDRLKQPYLLFYYCEKLPKQVKNQIFEYAKEHGLKVYGAGECDKDYSDITVNMTPFQWISMFRGAEFVFTGTFHGAVFSILNKRPFKVYLTNQSRIKKVGALLKELGLNNREITKDFVFDLETMKSEIDYEKVYEIISEKKEISKNYLKESIEGGRRYHNFI